MTTDTAEARNKNITTREDGVFVEGHGVYVHSVPAYLKSVGLDLETYKRQWPKAKLYSDKAQAIIDRKAAEKEPLTADMTASITKMPGAASKQPFADVFKLGSHPATKNARGQEIMVDVLGDPDEAYADFVPPIDDNYIFPIDALKAVMVAAQLNKPMLCWGFHGTGKTTLLEQYCARTNRPTIRVQHTVGTEKSDVVGHYVVKNGQTEWEPGPLMVAMKHGLVYIADEYDFALPSVTSVYQAVLEGKALVESAAPPQWRVTRPHPNFRFYATGNTNGSGDESGLYTGTQVMNAANYSRFAITIRMEYMPEAQEVSVIVSQSKILKEDASKLVSVANEIRKAFERQEISCTVSPRELINAAMLARVYGAEPDLTRGLAQAFTNRLNSVDKLAVDKFAQRHFG